MTRHFLIQAIRGLIWKHTVDINQTIAISVTMHLFKQAIWGFIWCLFVDLWLQEKAYVFEFIELSYEYFCPQDHIKHWYSPKKLTSKFRCVIKLSLSFALSPPSNLAENWYRADPPILSTQVIKNLINSNNAIWDGGSTAQSDYLWNRAKDLKNQ